MAVGDRFVADFVNPEPLDIPSKLCEPLLAELIPQAQFARPTAVVSFAVDFNGQSSAVLNQCEIQVVLRNAELRAVPFVTARTSGGQAPRD